MPLEGPKSVGNWRDGTLTDGVSPTLDGGLENTPDNRIKDASLQELTPDGGTQGLRLLRGPTFDGNFIYSTPVDGGRDDLVKQNGIPLSPEMRTDLASGPIVETGPRPLGPFDPSLPKMILTKQTLAASKQGFVGGTRLAAVAVEDDFGALTTTTDPVEFTHANGQDIEWTPPADISEGGKRWVLFLSEQVASGSPKASTMRAQDRAPAGSGPKRLPGPYDFSGRKRPTTNETFIGRPPAPRWGGENPDLNLRSAPRDMEEMDLTVAIVESTPRGDSLASTRSNERHFDADKDHAVFVSPNKTHRSTTGFKVYFQTGTGFWYRVIAPSKVYSGRPFSLDRKVPIYGRISSEGGASDDGAWVTAIQENPPEEDTSGIEAPTGEMDPPVGIGAARPAAGTYLKTYAPSYGGEERRAAVPSRITIASTEMVLAEIPNPVNRLRNPEATKQNADGLPLYWTANLTNGVLADQLGKPGVATSGTVNNTTAGPFRETLPLEVASGVVETYAGILEVSGYAGSAGVGRVTLEETLEDASVVRTVLASRNTNGYTPFVKTVGEVGSGADVILNEGTVTHHLRVGTDSTSGRNMTVRAFDLILYPGVGAPKKLILPPEGTAGIASQDVPPETPYLSGPIACITRPKSATPPPSFTPVQVLDADVTPDPTTAGYTSNKTASGLVVLGSATGASGMEGTYYRARSDLTTARAIGFYEETYAIGSGAGQVNGSSLAVRGPFLFPLIPTRSGNNLYFLAILDASGNYMGILRVNNSGNVALLGRNQNGNDTVQTPLTGLSVTDLLDAEIIVGGGNTTKGRVSLVGGLNSESRAELASIEGLNFTSRVPRMVRFMGIRENDTAGKWEVLCEWIRVTSSGDVVAEYGAEPGTPDRPTGADAALRELDEDELPINQLYIHIPPGFKNQTYGAVFDDFYVKPLVQQTLAVYARREDALAQGTPTYRLTLFNDETGESWAAPVPTALDAGVTGTAAWADCAAATFTPPAGFYRARLEVLRSEQGIFIFQGFLHADGALTTHAARDAKRTKGIWLSGTFTTLISGKVPPPEVHRVLRPHDYGEKWIRLGVTAEIPDGSSVSALYAAGDAVGALSPQESNPLGVPWNREFVEIEGTLNSDGREGPKIPPGGAALTYRTELSTLLRSDRSSLLGGTVVTDIDRAYQGRDYRTDPVAGEARPVGLTRRIGRLDGFYAAFFDPSAVKWFKEEMLEQELIIEHVAANAIYRVRLYEYSEAEPFEADLPEEIIGYVHTVFQVSRAQVLEVGVLDPALGGLR